MKKIVSMGLGVLLAGAVSAQAAPPVITQQVTPGTMSYQGRLQTADGIDYSNGIYTVDFKLYDAASGGTLLWGATYKPYVNNGFFSVILGQTSVGEVAISGALYPDVSDFWKGVWIDPNSASKARYLGITVHEGANNQPLASYSESFPRQQLLASPFAIQAQFAQQAETANASTEDFTVNGALSVNNGIDLQSGSLKINANGTLNLPGVAAIEDTEGGYIQFKDGIEFTGAQNIALNGGTIRDDSGNVVVDDTLYVGGDLTVNGSKKIQIGSCAVLALPPGEPESSDLLVGNDVFVDDRLYVGDDILVQDKLVMNYNQPDEHVLTHIVEAPASGVRIIAGRVWENGSEQVDIGGKYSVSHSREGVYDITFTQPFSINPVVIVSGGSGDHAEDNLYRVLNISTTGCTVDSRDDNPDGGAPLQDACFNFIVVGN